MSHRVNHYHEQLQEHLTERQWSEEDKRNFLHMVGRSALMSAQGVLSVLEYQQAVDERIEREKRIDDAFVPRVIPQDFFEQRFTQPEPLSYDDMGNYTNPEAGV